MEARITFTIVATAILSLVGAARANTVSFVFEDGAETPVVGGTYMGTQDVQILSAFDDENNGGRPNFGVGTNNSPHPNASLTRPLLRFNDLDVLAGLLVTAATLELTVVSVQTGSLPDIEDNTVDAFQVFDTDWVEGINEYVNGGPGGLEDRGVTWNRKNQTNHDPLEGPMWNEPGLEEGTERGTTVLGTFSYLKDELPHQEFFGTRIYSADGVKFQLPFNADGINVIQSWIDGAPIGGFYLKAQNEVVPAGGLNYYSREGGVLGNRPRLILDVVPEPSTGLLLLGLGLGFGLKRPRLRRAADRQDVLAR